jgi:hypothetical protein
MIQFGEFSMRRIKYNISNKYIDELKTIALNSVDTIPNNPIFKGNNINNKIVLIIYHKNNPVGLNIMFDYKYENYKCLHLGLVLIDKKYQGKKLQSYTKYNIIFYILENLFSNIYISDIGRSASGLKIFNLNVKNSYPNLITDTKINNIYKKIFNDFFNKFKNDSQISDTATANDDSFIIKNKNDSNGGANYLLQINNFTKSRDNKYNTFIENNLNEADAILSIGKVNIFDSFF